MRTLLFFAVCVLSAVVCFGGPLYEAGGAQFECQDAGLYPDLFDCTQYYACSASVEGGLITVKNACPSGSAFNAKTFQCDLSESDPVCNGHPIECPESGLATGPLPQNPSLYYVCKSGYPYLFRCLDGIDYTYDPALFICVQHVQYEDCVPGKYQAVPHTYRNGYMCDEYMPMTRGRVTCPKYFDRETRNCGYGENPYPDEWHLACPTKEVERPVPKTCNMYYKCSSGTEDVKSCPNYFDRKLGICQTGKCPYDEDSL